MEERLLQVWLSLAKLKPQLRRQLQGDVVRIERQYAAEPGGTSLGQVKELMEQCRNQGIQVLLPTDERYHRVFSELAGIGAPTPFILYMKGDPTLLEAYGVAIVGSRRLTAYGRRVTARLVESLRTLPVTIVSGGARGVDTVAHTTAIACGLPTVCVLGCGIARAYPAENRELFHRIGRDHLLLSEYPPQTGPQKYFFPERNRIIAQLSRTVAVTSAARRSGALITAECAMDYDHIIATVPYELDDPMGQGCLFLAGGGARLLTDPADLGTCVRDDLPDSFLRWSSSNEDSLTR
ncbi:MAG: DNA-processing protein DprA [Clostridiaceae bacterium]